MCLIRHLIKSLINHLVKCLARYLAGHSARHPVRHPTRHPARAPEASASGERENAGLSRVLDADKQCANSSSIGPIFALFFQQSEDAISLQPLLTVADFSKPYFLFDA